MGKETFQTGREPQILVGEVLGDLVVLAVAAPRCAGARQLHPEHQRRRADV